jgi:hypothetical protein
MQERRGRAIAQFMWAYQSPFRISAKVSLRSVLEAIGFLGDADLVLVGVEVEGEHVFPICIEPEDGPFDPGMLSGVQRRSEELYDRHPDRRLEYSDRQVQASRRNSLQQKVLGQAIGEALAASAPGAGRAFFAEMPTRVDDYDVYVIASIESDTVAQVPRLETTQRHRIRVWPSLVHAVIGEVVRRAQRALYLPEAGSGLGVLDALAPEIAQSAAAAFVRSVFLCADYWFAENSGATVSAISALPYEGRPGSGQLVIAEESHPALDIRMRFSEPVPIDNTRAVRKLLEASGGEGDLLSNGERIFGLGRLTTAYDPVSETAFIVSITGRGTWELSHAGHALMTVRDGIPQLPKPSLDAAYFTDTVERLLSTADASQLLRLAEAAGQSEHGAMLIISSKAAAEALRLAPQAWAVQPAALTPGLLLQLTGMDGGVLVDDQGRCHAIGVILDGQACGGEDPARGSRFNNAVRYLKSGAPPAVVVVHSTDGSIDVLPRLQPRVRRGSVEAAVLKYLALAIPGEHPPGQSDAWERVKRLRFYLSEEQCQRVNQARAALEALDREHNFTRVIETDLTPDPCMDGSYWLPETD